MNLINIGVGLALLLATASPAQSISVTEENDGKPFGVDCSFPVQYKNLRCGDHLGDRKKIYEDFMEGCYEAYGRPPCDDYEDERIKMSLRQPQSMVNYTSTGFKKRKAPPELWNLLKTYWDKNKDSKKEEIWAKGNIYTNHFHAPTYMVSVEDRSMVGGGLDLKQAIWDAAQPVIEEWTGMELNPISLYGIRVYTEGAILSPHADRLPLVSSCIVNVAQDIEEDWVLEVYDRDGNAVNVTMEPGDMVLYESGSLIHGRPFPLKGNYYANIFIHFEPTGRPLNYENYDYAEDLDHAIPPYIIKGSPEEANWKRRNPNGWHTKSPTGAHVDTLPVYAAAEQNDVKTLEKLGKQDKRLLAAKDRNGWQPIHEAARGGSLESIDMLVKNGVDVNSRAQKGKGYSPLGVALEVHGESHPVVQFLKDLGGAEYGPDL